MNDRVRKGRLVLVVLSQVAQARKMSARIYAVFRLRNSRNLRICMGKTVLFLSLEYEGV